MFPKFNKLCANIVCIHLLQFSPFVCMDVIADSMLFENKQKVIVEIQINKKIGNFLPPGSITSKQVMKPVKLQMYLLNN